jgi:DNA-binding response OmpR family regulator
MRPLVMENDGHIVLIVDDEPGMCWALQNLLAAEEFDSRSVQTGEAALQLIETMEFTIALLDVMLPDMSGFELARRVKTVAPSIRIFMISGYYYKDDIDIKMVEEAGLVQGFIAKPFLHEEVIALIKG